jgi:GT2 family glycosyltransferase
MTKMNKGGKLNVSIIIPYYKTPHLLTKNMPSVIKAMEYGKNIIKEIILVDDGSDDECAKIIKREFPTVKLITHKVNRGFSATVNTGARTSKGSLLALINTDVIPEQDFLVHANSHFADEKVFAVSLHEKGFGWARGNFEKGFVGFEKGEESKNINDTFWVSGGSGLFRRNLWMKLGGLDEELFSPFYWEDLDLSYRAVKRGYKLIWEPQAKVLHNHESTVSMLPDKNYVQRIRERNQLIFIWKNITSPRLIKKHISGLMSRLVTHPGYLRIVMMAGSMLPKILKARRKEIKESRVSDEAIFSKFSS